jgi:hypothetical protein
MAAADQRKARIVAHMNRGHARELSHYLRHYARASAAAASSPLLEDMTVDGMTIAARGGAFAVPFAPPLASLDDARERLIAMDAEARAALGISDVVVDTWAAPSLAAAGVGLAVLFYFACYLTLPWTAPGSPAFALIDPLFPGGASTFRGITRAVFWPVIAIHFAEVVIFDRTRAHKYSIPRWSRTWWLWSATCFVCGFTAFSDVDALAARKKAEKDAKSH